MTITDTTTLPRTDLEIPPYIGEINLKVNDVTKLLALADLPETHQKLELVAYHNPYFAGELAEIELDICSAEYKTVKFGLKCLNRMIRCHNEQVKRLRREEAIRLEREQAMQSIGKLDESDPRYPAWLRSKNI